MTHDLDDSSQLPWLEDRGIALFRGAGRLDGERRVRVGDDVVEARVAVVVATKAARRCRQSTASPRWSHGPTGRSPPRRRCPRGLIVLGAGVVGVEMAQAWATLGSRVTLVQQADRVIENFEPFASEHVADGLRGIGVEVLLGITATAACRADGQVTLDLDDGRSVSRRRAARGRGANSAHRRHRVGDRRARAEWLP